MRWKMNKNNTVLVTAIGSFSATVVIAKLKEAGIRVVGTDIYEKELIANAYNVDCFYQVPKANEQEKFLNVIRTICKQESVTHIFPLTDVEIDVLSRNRDSFCENGVVLCMSSAKTIELCRDKMSLHDFLISNCEETNPVPTKRLIDCDDIPFPYPMVCKPYNGRSSENLFHIKNKNDWQWIRANEEIERFIIQPEIQGNIITVDVIRDQTKAVVISRREYLRTVNGAGRSVEVFFNQKLNDMAVCIANILEIIGCVNFEFIEDSNGNYHFLECNPRFSGGVAFSCLTGYDCVKNHLRAFNNIPIEEFSLAHNYFMTRQYTERITEINKIMI